MRSLLQRVGSGLIWRGFIGAALAHAAVGCGATPPIPARPTSTSSSAAHTLVFRGMCDASGAVALGGTRFAVGDDEDNVLRVYDSARGGEPLYAIDVSPALDLPVKKRTPEADIEAATRLGEHALWLTSHGLNSKGKLQPGRFRFFATTAPAEGTDLKPVGKMYTQLLDDMLQAPELERFGLAEAIQHAPKTGGLNIEGMTRHADGQSVLIGFRNPRPQGKALLVPLLNPLRVLEGEPARFGEPSLLDLGGLGVRALSYWRGRYLVMAGPMDESGPSRLYVWDGAAEVAPAGEPIAGFNPEAFVSREDSDQVLLLSDDGSLEIDGVPCKKLVDRGRMQFRGVWMRIAPSASGVQAGHSTPTP